MIPMTIQGVVVGRKWRPLDSVGSLYALGYAGSLLSWAVEESSAIQSRW